MYSIGYCTFILSHVLLYSITSSNNLYDWLLHIHAARSLFRQHDNPSSVALAG